MKKAILFGASGFIGSYLLNELLNNTEYEQVIIVVRRKLDIIHPKLNMLIGDYQALPGLKNNLVANDVFITLGTTKKKTPDQCEYYQVDHDYPVLAAKIARENGATAVFLVSSVGADVRSRIFYLRTKGETERDIKALDFAHTHIFRPSLIMGDRKESRPLEKGFMSLWAVINPVLAGTLKKYRGMDGQDIARAMNNAAKLHSQKITAYHWKDMNALLK